MIVVSFITSFEQVEFSSPTGLLEQTIPLSFPTFATFAASSSMGNSSFRGPLVRALSHCCLAVRRLLSVEITAP